MIIIPTYIFPRSACKFFKKHIWFASLGFNFICQHILILSSFLMQKNYFSSVNFSLIWYLISSVNNIRIIFIVKVRIWNYHINTYKLILAWLLCLLFKLPAFWALGGSIWFLCFEGPKNWRIHTNKYSLSSDLIPETV